MGVKLKIRSKKIRNAARGQACVNCGINDGTTVAAHYQGMRSLAFGKGTGSKPHDVCVAFLCCKCHMMFDAGEGSFVKDRFQRKVDLSERFLYCVMLTVIKLCEMGVLYTDDMSLGRGR
jgi:hypothetical protein